MAPPSTRIVFELKKFSPRQMWMVWAFANRKKNRNCTSDLQLPRMLYQGISILCEFVMCRESILSLFAVFEAIRLFIRQKTKILADDTCNLFIYY